MTPLFDALKGRDTRRGLALMGAMMKMGGNKYRLYAEAKARIPKDLPAKEYEAEILRLTRKYRI